MPAVPGPRPGAGPSCRGRYGETAGRATAGTNRQLDRSVMEAQSEAHKIEELDIKNADIHKVDASRTVSRKRQCRSPAKGLN